jgi:hypothetical protein
MIGKEALNDLPQQIPKFKNVKAWDGKDAPKSDTSSDL